MASPYLITSPPWTLYTFKTRKGKVKFRLTYHRFINNSAASNMPKAYRDMVNKGTQVFSSQESAERCITMFTLFIQ